jgi:PTS system mannose-specific IIA component
LIGLVLVGHGGLAEALRRSLEAIVGDQPNLATVCVGPHDNSDERRDAVSHAIVDANDGAGVIVVADMFGATPCNLVLSVAGRHDVELIAGANLPMLVELAKARRTLPRAECVARGTVAGRHCIAAASRLLARMDVNEADRPGRLH